MKNTLLNRIGLISSFFNQSGIDTNIDDVLNMDNLPSYWEMYTEYLRHMKSFTELTKIYNTLNYTFDYESSRAVKSIKRDVENRMSTIAQRLNKMGFYANLFDGRTNAHILYTRLIR